MIFLYIDVDIRKFHPIMGEHEEYYRKMGAGMGTLQKIKDRYGI